MSDLDKQIGFSLDLAKLIERAYLLGFGDVLLGQHRSGLGIYVYLFKGGVYISDSAVYGSLGRWWCGLSASNSWGACANNYFSVGEVA